MTGIEVPAPSERPLLLQAYRALLYAVTSAGAAAREGATGEERRESGEAYEVAEKAIAALAAPLPAPSEREALRSALSKLIEVYDAMGCPRGPARIIAEAALSTPPLQERDAPLTDFDRWAEPILGDNPNWRESGPGELARQAWRAALDRPDRLHYQGRQTGVVQGCSPDPDAPATSSAERSNTVGASGASRSGNPSAQTPMESAA